MKHSTRLADAVHVLVFIHLGQDGDLRSAAIATSLATNPSFVRQIMGRLRAAGLLASTPGHPRPELARDPAEISLLDVYRAVEAEGSLLHLDTHTNPACGVGMGVQHALAERFDQVQQAAEAQMATITVADVVADHLSRLGRTGLSVPQAAGGPGAG